MTTIHFDTSIKGFPKVEVTTKISCGNAIESFELRLYKPEIRRVDWLEKVVTKDKALYDKLMDEIWEEYYDV